MLWRRAVACDVGIASLRLPGRLTTKDSSPTLGELSLWFYNCSVKREFCGTANQHPRQEHGLAHSSNFFCRPSARPCFVTVRRQHQSLENNISIDSQLLSDQARFDAVLSFPARLSIDDLSGCWARNKQHIGNNRWDPSGRLSTLGGLFITTARLVAGSV